MWNPFQTSPPDDEGAESPFELSASDVPVRPENEHDDSPEHRILRALEEVVDPELGLNIVDLGLVYAVDVTDSCIRLALTSTTPACPMADAIRRDVEHAVRDAVGEEFDVESFQVWEPKWTPEFMSAEARDKLGATGSATEGGVFW